MTRSLFLAGLFRAGSAFLGFSALGTAWASGFFLPVWACFLALEAFLAGSSAGVLLSSFFFPLVLPRKKHF